PSSCTLFSADSTAPTGTHPSSLHDALPIYLLIDDRHEMRRPTVITSNLSPEEFRQRYGERIADRIRQMGLVVLCVGESLRRKAGDRKSTRLNSSHVKISYAVFCLKKKTYTT